MVASSLRVLPLSRAWHSLASCPSSATPLNRTVRGHSIISRPQRITPTVLCNCHQGGDRASRRVWCSHTLAWHLCTEIKSGHEPECRLRRDLHSGKMRKSALRGSLSLDTGRPHTAETAPWTKSS